MRKLIAWLGVAMLVVVCGSAPARAGDPLKPYVVLAFDTSGSMASATGAGQPSCGGADTRLNHARCAVNRIVNSYGDMVFALGRFRTQMSGTFPSCTAAGPDETGGVTCNATADMFELLSPLIDGQNDRAAVWTDGTINTCTAVGSDPEIWRAGGNTPLGGTLLGSKLYWQGQQSTNFTIWPANTPGFNPIVNDPLAQSFLPKPNKPATCNPNPTTCDNTAGCTSQTNCCCLEQCRPYIVILMTDGDETCSGDAPAAALSLLSTDIGAGAQTRRYRIETRPIGFGKPVGDADIEAIAHNGGVPDDGNPATNEGFYAENEAELQLAISNILDDAIRTEQCNNLDDDCDVLVDEDFPAKNTGCNNGMNGVCRVVGTNLCRTDGSGTFCDAGVTACNGVPAGGACTVTNSSGTNIPGTCIAGSCTPNLNDPFYDEVCNNRDDDCDGKIDEGLTGCVCNPVGESCDNDDDDCDGNIDEGLTRPCGTGTCQGIETCTNGVYGGCTAPSSSTEICDGLDNNCDGIRDGLQAACSTMPPQPPSFPPVDNPTNNPGHPSKNPIPENRCKPGVKVCPANVGPPNSFGSCTGEIFPCNVTNAQPDSCADLCDGVDFDCDNIVDEDFQEADCSSNCGIGTTDCVNGQIVCNSVPVGTDTTCNNIDDDCDNAIDEEWVSPGACGAGPPPVVCDGVIVCQMGVEVCVGDPVGQESCNCDDDDCDNAIDEGTLCGSGSQCKFCQCAQPCAQDEFPCPMGKFCKQDQNGQGFCIADPCFDKPCPPVNGVKQVCVKNQAGNDATCEPACSQITCGANEVCIPESGECKPDNCHTFPNYCATDELCIAGMCKKDLCKNVTCGANQYCVQGQCYGSCADVECADGQRCRMGVCEQDPCGGPCPFGQVCIESSGECKPDPCAQIPCPIGQYCNPQTVACEDDPCAGTTCPGAGQVCKGGTCFDETDLLPDAPTPERVTTGGGGGCATSGGSAGFVLALLALGLISRRRRTAGGRS